MTTDHLTAAGMTPERLVALRTERNLSQRALAAQSGLSKSLVSQLETGAKVFTDDNVRALAAAFDLAAPSPSVPAPIAAILRPLAGTVEPVAHAAIARWEKNPRRHFDPTALEELAESIAVEGVLEPIMVRPKPADDGRFLIVIGERRWRAVGSLIEAGRAAGDYPMPVVIRHDLADDTDALLVAVSENLQREDLSPLEEGEAFALLEPVIGTDGIRHRTGKTRRFVQQRIALVKKLCPEAQEALAAGEIKIEAARILTAAAPAAQAEAVARLRRHWYVNAESLKRDLFGRWRKMADALFPADRYTGGTAEDPENGTVFATDTALFDQLQREAVDARAARFGEKYAWVEVLGPGEYFSDWKYEPCKDKKVAGVVLDLAHDGHVTIRTDLKKLVSETPAAATADDAEKPKQLPFTKDHLRLAARHKTRAVQAAIAADPRTAKVLAIVGLLGASRNVRIGTKELNRGDTLLSPAVAAILEPFRERLGGLVEKAPKASDAPDRQPLRASRADHYRTPDGAALYAALKALDDAALDVLFAALVAVQFSAFPPASNGDEAELGDAPLTLVLVEDLAVEPLTLATVGPANALDGLRRGGLAIVAGETGVAITESMSGPKILDALDAGIDVDTFRRYCVPSFRWGSPKALDRAWKRPTIVAAAAAPREAAEGEPGFADPVLGYHVNADGRVVDTATGLDLVSLRSKLMKIDDHESRGVRISDDEASFEFGEALTDLYNAGLVMCDRSEYARGSVRLTDTGRERFAWLGKVTIGNGRVIPFASAETEAEELDPLAGAA